MRVVPRDSDLVKSIPFDDIVAGATVRFSEIDGVQYLSIRDVIMHVCGKDGNDAAEIWRSMSDEKVSEVKITSETFSNCSNFKFPGRGQQDQPVITFPGAIKLLMFLPGEKAKTHRSAMVSILIRYFAGDPSLLNEIEANAVSESPIAVMARASIASESETQATLKRKREEELEYEKKTAELHALKVNTVGTFAATMAMINPNWRDDTRLRLQTEDWLKNVAFNSGMAAITNGEAAPLSKSVSVTQVARELGYNLSHANQIKAGRLVATKYRAKYDAEPPTHAQWVDGAERMVKSYTEADRKLIVEALAEPGFGSQD